MLLFSECIFLLVFIVSKLSILVGVMDVVRGALFFLPNPKDILYFREQLPWKLACLLACCVLSYVPIGIMLPLQSRVLA